MFTRILATREKDILCKTLRFLMESDGIISEEEKSFLDATADALGMDPTQYCTRPDYDALQDELRSVSNTAAGRVILMELANIAYADEEYCEQERADIKKIAGMMGVDSLVLGRIETWVSEGIEHAKRGQQLFLKGE